MLKAEEQMELAVLKKHRASIRGLSRSTGRSRNTVRRYLRVAMRWPSVRQGQNGPRSSIRSRLTLSIG